MRFSLGVQNRRTGLPGRIGGTVFFGVFLGMGVLFLYLLGLAAANTLATYQWSQTPATVVRSGVVEDLEQSKPFLAEVEYRYLWEGRTYTSRQIGRGPSRHDSYDRAWKKAAGYPVGREVACYVNPSRPDEAILEREGFWTLPFALIPLIFVGVGAWGIYGLWFPGENRRVVRSAVPAGSSRRSGRWVAVALGGIFTAVGGGLLVFWTIPTLIKAQASVRWTETPCTVISSRVKTHSGDDGTTYSVDIFYRYAVAGKDYKSNRYDHFGGSSSGRAGKVRVVEKYPPGAQAVCFVNPDDPTEAVLRPGLGWSALFGLIPLVFFGVGLVVLLAGIRAPALVGAEGTSPPGAGTALEATGPLALKSTLSPVGKLAVAVGLALFWNGILAVFVWDVADGFLSGNPDWFVAVFMVPFVVVGLGLLWGVVYCAAALANPRCHLQLDSPTLHPGGLVAVAWEFRGSVHRMSRLRIFLEGREEATYKRGTSTSTDHSVFARIPLVDLSSWMDMVRGTGQVRIPERTVPSFAALHNKVVWHLKVHGEIARWPDVQEDYEITVHPVGKGAA